MMEFTKAEKKIMESSLAGRQRGQTIFFIAGIVLIIAGMGVWAYSYFLIVPAGETTVKKMEAGISGIQVNTQQGAALKKMLLESKKQIAKDRKDVMETAFNQVSFYLLLTGFLLIVVTYENRTYCRLIRKLLSQDGYEAKDRETNFAGR